jgi:hypothetical protein
MAAAIVIGIVPLAPQLRAQVPRLVEMPLTALGANGPETRNALIAVSPAGRIAFTRGYDDQGRQLAVIDSNGKILARMGKDGMGPGELRMIMGLYMGDTTVVTYSAASARLTVFSPDGKLLDTHSITSESGGAPAAVVRDSIDFLAVPNLDAVHRLSIWSMTGRTVVPKGDPHLASLTASGTPPALPAFPAYAASPRQIVIGDPVAYRIQRFGPNGDATDSTFGLDLPARHPSAEEVEKARKKAQGPHKVVMPNGKVIQVKSDAAATAKAFAQRKLPLFPRQWGIQIDGKGRIWVVRASGDSTVFDIFRGRTLVGHRSIACSRQQVDGVSIAGSWIAVLCESESESRDVDLRLFHIVD